MVHSSYLTSRSMVQFTSWSMVHIYPHGPWLIFTWWSIVNITFVIHSPFYPRCAWSILILVTQRIFTICWNGSVPLNKIAAMPIYGKTLKNLLPIQESLRLNLGIQHCGLKVYQMCSNDDRSMTFDLFTARPNLRPHTVLWGNCWKVLF